MIDSDVLDRLQEMSARTGLSKSEQIRQGIQWWLESREWPQRGSRASARQPVTRRGRAKR
jgi:metal-responsive CopG/Arc/MetJ family transcriptional regulator